MADVEEDAEFGSHFLDSMLEVEMTEEDNELDVSKGYDPLETLPPTPTFDLQSETYSYKNVYRNAMPQPVLATMPLASSTTSNVPLVIKPNSMLIFSGEVPQLKPASVLAQKIPPKSIAKDAIKSVNISVDTKNATQDSEYPDEKFLKEVFKPEYVKNVFIKADPPSDIAVVGEDEMKYYKTCFKDVSKVQYCRLHCTICDKHLGCATNAEKKINVHAMLKVLTCKPCFEFYGDGNFPCDKGDNCEIYCRWCGQGGALVCCSFCPRVFCKRCVKRNFGTSFLKTIEKASDWACFCCAQKPLWPHRAVCRALLEYIARKKTDSKAPHRDTSSCCKGAELTRKKLRDGFFDKSKASYKVNPAAKSPEFRTRTLTPSKTGKEQISLKPIAQLKAPDKIKLNSIRNSKPSGGNIFSPKSIIAGNSIIRGIATTTPAKLYSAYSSPQLIQRPVLHGETLITPPSRLLLQGKTPANSPSGYNSSFVRVSLTHQAPNVDIEKIPTVTIPHEVQGLVLRLIFPDNKMQYVRLASDGTGCNTSKDFPMPSFPESGLSFVEENLLDAFKMTKSLYDKLTRITEKVNSRTKITEESVFNSSVNRLHKAYEAALAFLIELDKSLLEKQEKWKNGVKSSVDVIDISDDDAGNKKNKIKEETKDSDVEILDDVTVNGNNNFKEKYRLRSSSETGKTPTTATATIDIGIVRKRRRGRPRKVCKKLKTVGMQNGQPEEDPLKIEPTDMEECKDKIILGGIDTEDGVEKTEPEEETEEFETYNWTETETGEIKTESVEIPTEEETDNS